MMPTALMTAATRAARVVLSIASPLAAAAPNRCAGRSPGRAAPGSGASAAGRSRPATGAAPPGLAPRTFVKQRVYRRLAVLGHEGGGRRGAGSGGPGPAAVGG